MNPYTTSELKDIRDRLEQNSKDVSETEVLGFLAYMMNQPFEHIEAKFAIMEGTI